MQIRLIFLALTAVILGGLSGCATLFSGTTQNVSVQAVNARNNQIIPGAVCTITDGKGQVYALNSNPGSTIVSRGQGALNVQCSRNNYHRTQLGVNQSFNGVSIVNIFFWPGFIVDALTGAMQKYPYSVTVPMQPAG